jgi:hypothetical protein
MLTKRKAAAPPSSPPRAPVSSPPPTRPVAASSAICTTGRNSGSYRLHLSCALRSQWCPTSYRNCERTLPGLRMG